MLSEFLTKEYKQFVVSFFKNIEKGDLEYIYRGEVTPTGITNILDLAKLNLELEQEIQPLKSRIYFILGEGLQNITRHQEIIPGEKKYQNIIVISKQKDRYTITTGNIIKRHNREELEKKLETINQMSIPELQDLARYIRKNFDLTPKGGASLGLVEIAKRSGNRLLYSFRNINDEYCYFYFSATILTKKIEKEKYLRSFDNQYIEYIKDFHEYLDKQNIYLVFKGDFHQDNILALFDILRKQMPETSFTIKLKNILIEILQNIEKHADNIDGIEDWKPGIFTINMEDAYYNLTAANYVKNTKIPSLKERIDRINHLSKEELTKLYRETLLNMEAEVTAKKTGLGYIDIRRRSGHPLNYDFIKVNDDYSLYFLQVKILNNNGKNN